MHFKQEAFKNNKQLQSIPNVFKRFNFPAILCLEIKKIYVQDKTTQSPSEFMLKNH